MAIKHRIRSIYKIPHQVLLFCEFLCTSEMTFKVLIAKAVSLLDHTIAEWSLLPLPLRLHPPLPPGDRELVASAIPNLRAIILLAQPEQPCDVALLVAEKVHPGDAVVVVKDLIINTKQKIINFIIQINFYFFTFRFNLLSNTMLFRNQFNFSAPLTISTLGSA